MNLSSTDFTFVQRLVLERSAIVLDEEKRYLVETRLHGLAGRRGFDSVSVLLDHARADRTGGLGQQVVEAMTTNETSFFRDLHPFEALKKIVLPALIGARASQRRLGIWSAACST